MGSYGEWDQGLSSGIRSGICPTSVSTSEKVGFYLFRPQPFDLALWRPCTTFSLGPRPDPTARKVGSACLDQGLVPSAKPLIPLGWDLSLFFSFRPYGNCCSLHINGISPASTFSDLDLSISSLLRPSTTFSLGTKDLCLQSH